MSVVALEPIPLREDPDQGLCLFRPDEDFDCSVNTQLGRRFLEWKEQLFSGKNRSKGAFAMETKLGDVGRLRFAWVRPYEDVYPCPNDVLWLSVFGDEDVEIKRRVMLVPEGVLHVGSWRTASGYDASPDHFGFGFLREGLSEISLNDRLFDERYLLTSGWFTGRKEMVNAFSSPSRLKSLKFP